MNIILNEVKYAENMIANGDVGQKPTATIYLLGRYYRQRQNLSTRETIEVLNDFLRDNLPNYNPDYYEENIELAARNGKKYPLREIEYIGITQNELDVISLVPNEKHRRVLFSMLCYTKYHNTVAPQNSNWCNTEHSEIFKSAHVSLHTVADRCSMIHDIWQLRYGEDQPFIGFSRKNTNTNVRLYFVDMEGEPVLKINDFRNLGYEYMRYVGIGRYINCQECGRLVRITNSNDHSRKYCSLCATNVERLKTNCRVAKYREKKCNGSQLL